MTAAILLFREVLAAPSEALQELFAQRATLPAALAFFALYSAGSSVAAYFLPPSFLPDAPASAFGQPFGVYLLAGTAGGLVTTLLSAVFLPRVTGLLSAGRLAPRVLGGLIAILGYYLALSVLSARPAALALAALPPLAAARYWYRRDSFPGMLRVLLASSAIGAALLPVAAAAIIFRSRGLYELSMGAALIWEFAYLIKALRLSAGAGAPRAAVAVFFTLATSGLFLYNVSLLLPERFEAPLLLF